MKTTMVMAMAGLAVVCSGAVNYKKALEQKMMPDDAGQFSYTEIFNAFEAMDVAADQAWRNVKSRAEFDARRTAMREKMIAAIGGFPEKTPLNAVVKGVVAKNGYRVEKVCFESMPGLFVTGNLFIPENPSVKAPYPVVVVACGHSDNGKAAEGYQRGCVQAVEAGMAAFIYDPYEQGERKYLKFGSCGGHNLIGAKASLLGWSMPLLRIWDGIRAIDYVTSRKDIDASRVGFMGNSGGGTVTSLMMAVEPRIKAACPSCYLTNLRELCFRMGPQDAEQNIFGQLAFGLNHAGYVLLQDIPVAVTCCYHDMFPYHGTRESFRTVMACATAAGRAERYALADVPGPHGWKESTRASSIRWMRRWLKGEDVALDMPACRRLDLGFNPKTTDMGLTEAECLVSASGLTKDEPGYRGIHEILRDRLAAFDKARVALGEDEKARLVRDLAKIPDPAKSGLLVKELSSETQEGISITRLAFSYPSGLALPAVLFQKAGAAVAADPLLIVGDKGRGAAADQVQAAVAANQAALVVDLTCYGEIGALHTMSGHKHVFYGCDKAEEGPALMLYMMGESMVGRRAGDILAVAGWMKQKWQRPVALVASGTAVIPAAHAYAADRLLFAKVEVKDAPRTWREAVREEQKYPFLNCVNGALKYYDWPELLK